MNTDTVRLNITLPKELVARLDEMTGPRKRSLFIAEAIDQQIAKKQKEALDKELEEGYRATRSESLALSVEFEALDLEGWDEY